MHNITVKQIVDYTKEELDTITRWMFNWWGQEENYEYEEVEAIIKNSFNKNKLPQTYGMYLNDKLIGMYQFSLIDLEVKPNCYPWLCNVYIDNNYRNKGYSKILLNTVKDNLVNNTNYQELYLYTKEVNLYEKYGFKYLEDINTFRCHPQVQRLYKLSI